MSKEVKERISWSAKGIWYKNIKMAPLLFLGKYKGKPEFEEHFYQIN